MPLTRPIPCTSIFTVRSTKVDVNILGRILMSLSVFYATQSIPTNRYADYYDPFWLCLVRTVPLYRVREGGGRD